MAKAWRKTETYHVPVIGAKGTSQYLVAKIQWLKVRMDDGELKTMVGKILITEPNYGEV